jgi:glycogen operon protein
LTHPHSGPFAPLDEHRWGELDAPLGAHCRGGFTTFALYSRNAQRVLLEIYDVALGEPARYDYWLERGRDQVFRAKIQGVPAGTLYGFRCWGQNWPFSPEFRRGNSVHGFIADVDREGNRYNPNKLLFDPYARELSHDRETPAMKGLGHHAGMYGSGPGLYAGFGDEPVVRRVFDTGPFAPKSVVVDDSTSVGEKPLIAQKDMVIYEVHPRGFTRHPSSQRLERILEGIPGFEQVCSVPREYRGTYKGAGYAAAYLKALGCNAVEFLPVHEAANALCPDDEPEIDRAPSEPPHGTYWGYMTYGYFAPDRRYAYDQSPGGPTREFKQMVKAFHDQGIAVVLDVVYNHSGEGGIWDGEPASAELLFLRGIDNAEYYALTGEGNRYYWDSTGCGNNLDCSKRCVERLILDSLEYWARTMGVDGFRFDLATVLGREASSGYAFRTGAELLRSIESLAEEEQFFAIAEAWDTGGGGYQVGNFPCGWAEWNGAYRDAVRRFLRGEEGRLRDFIGVVNGDYAHFADQGGPHKSINFITAHDGFTLLDLVSYNEKNNQEIWPFGPSDGGADQNDSWDSAGDAELRRQRMRNFITVLVFSRGVPMIRGGDEFAQTLNGNNNPYKIDSVATWHNFDMIATNAPTSVPTGGPGAYHDNYGVDRNPTGKNGLFLFFQQLLELRKRHSSLRQDKFADFEMDAGDDVTYLYKKEDGVSDLQGWERCVSLRINGSEVGDADFALLINMSPSELSFSLPSAGSGAPWQRLIDTAAWAESSGNWFERRESALFASGAQYGVHGWAIAVFRQLRR